MVKISAYSRGQIFLTSINMCILSKSINIKRLTIHWTKLLSIEKIAIVAKKNFG